MTVLTPTEVFDINCDDEKYENKKIKAVVKVNEVPFFKNKTSSGKFNLRFLKDLVVKYSYDGKQINNIITLILYYIIVVLLIGYVLFFSIIIIL
jgi:hypothetical protein